MIVLLRSLLWKELYELVRQPWMLIGAFLIPLYLLYVATTLVQPGAPVRVVFSYPPEEQGALDSEIEKLSRLEGIAAVEVANNQDINRLMAQYGATVGILLSADSGRIYVERSSSALERRLNFELAARINRAFRVSEHGLSRELENFMIDGGPRLELRHLSVIPGSDNQIFVPRFFALVTVFLATVLGARSMLRELESRTLPLLITPPHSGWTMVLAAKLTFVVGLTATVTAFLLLTLHPVFDFYLRPGVAGIYGSGLLAALASACIGTGLALLGNSTTQAYLAVSVYLIANLILTGFATNLQELSASGETFLRALFPLTYLRPVFEGWLFFGEPASWRAEDLVALAVHSVVSLLLLTAIAWHRQRQF